MAKGAGMAAEKVVKDIRRKSRESYLSADAGSL